MAARWSSENVVVEFRDSQATAMSVDCLGQHAVLSGRRFLYIVNLDAPFEGHRKISRQSKWDIGAVQWNPHDSFSHYFAASSNQRVDLYKWKDGSGEVGTTLQGHTRVISDLDWAVFEPDLLVTSSVDTYIYIWDIKDTRKPTVALSAVAGASQVKWNKKNANCLATSHDGDVRIWDKRKPSTAVEYLAAHLSKIHGLDWHPDSEHILATSSQDNSVKGFLLSLHERKVETKVLRKKKKFTCSEVARKKSHFRRTGSSEEKHSRYTSKGEKLEYPLWHRGLGGVSGALGRRFTTSWEQWVKDPV